MAVRVDQAHVMMVGMVDILPPGLRSVHPVSIIQHANYKRVSCFSLAGRLVSDLRELLIFRIIKNFITKEIAGTARYNCIDCNLERNRVISPFDFSIS